MENWLDVVTPRDIAARLGLGGERPDKTLRARLRDIHRQRSRSNDGSSRQPRPTASSSDGRANKAS